jgi:predicted transcriptional regulator YdeE
MRVRELGELLLVGINVVCTGESEYITAIPKLALELKQRINEIQQIVNPHLMIGAFKGDSDSEDGYWACVQVKQFGDIPQGMHTIVVPPNHYAVKWHYGHRSQVSSTYRKLQELIDEAGFNHLNKSWGIEILRNWGNPEEGEIEMDLYCTILGRVD